MKGKWRKEERWKGRGERDTSSSNSSTNDIVLVEVL